MADVQALDTLLNRANLLVFGVGLFAAMCAVAWTSSLLRRGGGAGSAQAAEKDSSQEGYVVSAVLGLLALLMGFTFSLAIDRFEGRRRLVLEEANAIGTTYLRAQLLPEPHRQRMSDLLVRYTDNRIALAKAAPAGEAQRRLLQTNDALVTDLWAATTAAFDSVADKPFSATYLDSVNALIDLDQSRKTARQARVPPAVFAVLLIYLITTAGVLGYVLKGRRGQIVAGFLLAVLTLSLMLVMDINRPAAGVVTETQQPMEDLRRSLAAQPPAVFDKWRPPAAP